MAVAGQDRTPNTTANSDASAQTAVATPSFPKQPLPPSGTIFNIAGATGIAPFEVKTAAGANYLVKLVSTTRRQEVLSMFVRGGHTVEIEVPLGTYELRYASGETWYGPEHLFGNETQYSKADESFTFEETSRGVSGFTVTLYQVRNGNLSTSRIRPSDF